MLVVQKKPFRRLRDSDLLSSLAAIDTFARQRGYAPSIRELMSLLDLCSTSVVVYHLDKLKARGWLAQTPKGAVRALGITDAGRRALAGQREPDVPPDTFLQELIAAVDALDIQLKQIRAPLPLELRFCWARLQKLRDTAREAV